ncbi:DUF2750 domain-containing protein [Thalassotalea ponticola]|uniref:DUF2750 domain-containing protein n=1 Tax=Thalassotalea ponticola TaxID=1523392 RepID=UPI0025B3A09C|nr:DUF2750 domain-containing protein [Thalassotalea ponticola]MDN3651912.1 DUF2750 domain-containing protein [Thalassotalea ponticola]
MEQEITDAIVMINQEQRLFALTTAQGDWVVCDSEQDFADVLPIWASSQHAQRFCVDQWQDYQVGEIDVETFLEEWVADLNDDNVGIGVSWELDKGGIEMNVIDFAKLLAKAL